MDPQLVQYNLSCRQWCDLHLTATKFDIMTRLQTFYHEKEWILRFRLCTFPWFNLNVYQWLFLAKTTEFMPHVKNNVIDPKKSSVAVKTALQAAKHQLRMAPSRLPSLRTPWPPASASGSSLRPSGRYLCNRGRWARWTGVAVYLRVPFRCSRDGWGHQPWRPSTAPSCTCPHRCKYEIITER